MLVTVIVFQLLNKTQKGPYHFTRSQNVNPSVPEFVNVRFLQDRKEDRLLEKKSFPNKCISRYNFKFDLPVSLKKKLHKQMHHKIQFQLVFETTILHTSMFEKQKNDFPGRAALNLLKWNYLT